MEHEQNSGSTDHTEVQTDAIDPTGIAPSPAEETSLDQVAAAHTGEAPPVTADSAASAPVTTEQAPTAPQPGAGMRGVLTAMLGLAAMGSAAALAVDVGGHAAQLASHGLTPALLGGFGLVLWVAAAVQRRMERLAKSVRIEASAGTEQLASLRAGLSHLLDANRPPATGEELQYVVLGLQRHDVHAANLLRGMKLQAKAIADIGEHLVHANAALKRIESMFEALGGESRMIRERLVQTTTRRDLEEQKELLLGVEAHLQELAALPGSIQKLSERTATASELDRQSTLTRTLLGEKAQSTEKLIGEGLGRRIDERIAELQAALAKPAGDAGLDRLESCVRELQREVGSLALRASQPSAAPTAAEPAPVAMAAAAAPSTVATGSVLGANAGPGASDDAAAGVAQNAVGTRVAGAKNVLGAIARLKQMKS